MSLTARDFAKLFATTSGDVSRTCSAEISAHDFRYRRMNARQRDSVMLQVIKRIESPELTVAGDRGARRRWEKGWAENLLQFSRGGRDLSKLVPLYLRKNQPLRLNQDYVWPLDKDFELNWGSVFRRWLFGKYLGGVDSVYEFGCGTGMNLSVIAKLFPDKRLVGLDWSKSSREIINGLGDAYGWKISGVPFDLFAPDATLNLPANCAVLTFSALEQTGRRFEKFLRFLLRKKPAICIHVEPIVEWYDESRLVDYLAVMFHKRRHYLEGLLPWLKQLESKGLVEILRAKRCYFGSLFTDPYSQIVWRPIRSA